MSDRRSLLHEIHDERGVKFTDFNGWQMPVEYDGITDEHHSVRSSAGMFDVSHLGTVVVGGPDATELMQRLTTNDVTRLGPGTFQYSLITDESGNMLDDVMVHRFHGDEDVGAGFEDLLMDFDYLFVPNSGQDERMVERWRTYRRQWDLDATIRNVTEEYTMIAVQGPDAPDHLEAVGNLDDASEFVSDYVTVEGSDCLVTRSGYTGESGFELLVPGNDAEAVWNALECQPCGLGARDTLRLEAGFLLRGHEFDDEQNTRNPYEAGVGFAVDTGTDFVGSDSLEKLADGGPETKLVGIKLHDRGVPRQGYDVTTPDGERVGEVTSGTMSPTLEEGIGLGYVSTDYAEPETDVRVVVRGSPKRGTVVETPFLEKE